MTIFPLIVFVLCIALAALFEVAYNYIDKRWSTPLDRGMWTTILWLLVFVMTAVCQLIPNKPPESTGWGVIIVIAFLHILMSIMGDGFHRLPGPSRPNPPAPGTSSPTNTPKNRNIHKGQ
jgi:drug/metabolite transporter (DMT)-like permease